MSERYRDFDQAWGEHASEPVRLRAMGEEFLLPAELPACVPLRILALQKQLGSDAELPPYELVELSPKILTPAVYERLLEKGISIEKLSEIVGWVLRQYSPGEEADPKNPQAPPPAGA